ncbi:MAG TPA: gliding motility-associated C-terminal domain-containing protein [Chitinophagaceae bacterium]|nr:gliding motility-associated C-terminal domain-containing protein [Chitinophagaceae bacterium]
MVKETWFDSFVKPGKRYLFPAQSCWKGMSYIHVLFLLFFTPLCLQAQHNLVLNPGFEEYNKANCKNQSPDGIGYAFDSMTVQHWYNPLLGDYQSTPDFYVDIPLFSSNPYFSRGPRSGKACAKIVPVVVKGFTKGKLDGIVNIKEFVEGSLSEPLQKGHRYKVSFYTATGNRFMAHCRYNGWGLGFADKLIVRDTVNRALADFQYCAYCYEIPISIAAPACGIMFPDDADSVYVENTAVYTAHGGERYFVIGKLLYGNDPDNYYADPKVGGSDFHYCIDDVSVTEIPFGISGNDFLCPGEKGALSAVSGWDNYHWSTGDSSRTTSIAAPGQYWVTMNTSCGSMTDSFTVRAGLLPDQFSLGTDTTICSNQSIQLSAPEGYNYEWSTGAVTRSVIVNNEGDYSCTIRNQCGTVRSRPIHISLKYGPSGPPDILGNKDICDNNVLISTSLQTNSKYRLLWSTGDTGSTIKVQKPGYYALNHYNECWGSNDSVYVSGCKGVMGFPNAFTPNGDGRNDLFRPVIQDILKISDYACSVYNRYGQEVFHSSNPATGWDGTFQGQAMELGTYFYQCQYKEGGVTQYLKGSIHLLY